MEIHTGIDIVENRRIKEAVEKYGEKFLKRIFTHSEINYCNEKVYKYECLAARFAAKEATIKAIYSAFGVRLGFKEIEVRGKRNKPAEILLHLNPEKEKHLSKSYKIRVSISHEKLFSVATVILYTG